MYEPDGYETDEFEPMEYEPDEAEATQPRQEVEGPHCHQRVEVQPQLVEVRPQLNKISPGDLECMLPEGGRLSQCILATLATDRIRLDL